MMTDTTYTPKVATHCCVCGITLKDATSIEFGIGPICRKKYRYEDALPIDEAQTVELAKFLAGAHLHFPPEFLEKVMVAAAKNDSRRVANLLIYHASAEQGMTAVLVAGAMRILKYTELADKIEERLIPVHIKRNGIEIAVKTPYSPLFVDRMHGIPGSYFSRKNDKSWMMADSGEAAGKLLAALKECFAGEMAMGPKGVFTL